MAIVLPRHLPSRLALLTILSSSGAAAQPEPATPPPDRAVQAPVPPEPLVDAPLIEVHAGGLTAEEVVDRAVAASPALTARRARLDAAKAQVQKTTAQFFPHVTLSATYTRLSDANNSLGGALVGAENPGLITTGPCPADVGAPVGSTCVLDAAGAPVGAASVGFPSPRNAYALEAEVGVPISDYVLTAPSAIAATRTNARAHEADRRLTELAVAHEARTAFHDWLRAVAATSVSKVSLARSQALYVDAQAALEAGLATRADLLRVESLVASAELKADRADKLEELAAARLAVLMGESPRAYQPGQPLPVGRSLPPAPPRPATDRRELDRLLKEAERNRLELTSLDERAKAIRQAQRATSATRLPRLDGFGHLSHAKPNERYMLDSDSWHTSWAVGLRLSYTINDTFTSGADARELKAQRAEIAAQRREIERAIHLQVTDAYLEVRQAARATVTAEKAQEAAAEAYRVSRELYQAGELTTTDLIETEREFVAASLQRVNSVIALEVARLNLDHALGRDAS